MLKFIGLVMVVAVGSLLGNAFSQHLVKRADTMLSYANMSRRIGQEIAFSAAPLEEILKECVNDTSGFCLKNLSVLPNRANCITSAETKAVQSFFSSLGKSDVATQKKLCEAYSFRFSELYNAAKEECNQKCRIYRVLGLFGGIAIAIMLV